MRITFKVCVAKAKAIALAIAITSLDRFIHNYIMVYASAKYLHILTFTS